VVVGMGGSVQGAQTVLLVGFGSSQRLGAEVLGHDDESESCLRWDIMGSGMGMGDASATGDVA
jgi:hypothetical protein